MLLLPVGSQPSGWLCLSLRCFLSTPGLMGPRLQHPGDPLWAPGALSAQISPLPGLCPVNTSQHVLRDRPPSGSAWAPLPALETSGKEGALTCDPAHKDGRLLLSDPILAAVPSRERSRLALSLTHTYISEFFKKCLFFTALGLC